MKFKKPTFSAVQWLHNLAFPQNVRHLVKNVESMTFLSPDLHKDLQQKWFGTQGLWKPRGLAFSFISEQSTNLFFSMWLKTGNLNYRSLLFIKNTKYLWLITIQV